MVKDTLNPKVATEGHMTRDTFLVLGVLILCFLGWQGWQIYSTSMASLNEGDTDIQTVETLEGGTPSGRIYLTLIRQGEEDLAPYIFDVTQKRFLAPHYEDHSAVFYQTFSGEYTAFVGTNREIYESVNENVNEARQVYVASINDDIPLAQVSSSEVITGEALRGKRTISISDDGTRSLFVAFEEAQGSVPIFTKEWGIYLATNGTQVTKITNGMYPHWIDNQNFIYLGDGGIYVYNIPEDERIILWEYSKDTQVNMMLHLSEDKSTLAWTLPGNDMVLVFRIDPSELPRIEKIAEINTNAFWPVVSPDGNFVAVQAVNWLEIETNPNPRLEFYSLSKKDYPRKLDIEVSLKEFDQQRMFITDWRR